MDTKIASTAYADAVNRLAGAASKGAAQAPGAEEAGGVSFAEALSQLGGGAVAAGRTGESAVLGAVVQQQELVDVITAVSNAEVTLQTVVALRDRVMSAYQEIIKMPI